MLKASADLALAFSFPRNPTTRLPSHRSVLWKRGPCSSCAGCQHHDSSQKQCALCHSRSRRQRKCRVQRFQTQRVPGKKAPVPQPQRTGQRQGAAHQRKRHPAIHQPWPDFSQQPTASQRKDQRRNQCDQCRCCEAPPVIPAEILPIKHSRFCHAHKRQQSGRCQSCCAARQRVPAGCHWRRPGQRIHPPRFGRCEKGQEMCIRDRCWYCC